MREIKFRAWLKATNEMVDVKSIHFESKVIRYYDTKTKDVRCAGFERIELMQFTGLKDKNGKEIYEGDIINVTTIGYYFANYIVSYDTNHLRFIATNGKNRNDEFFDRIPLNNEWDFEVIGNIYENKELLEE